MELTIDSKNKRLIILVSILTSLSVTLVFNLLSYGLPARAVNPAPTATLPPTTTTTYSVTTITPPPTIASLSPSSAPLNSPKIKVMVNGTNFCNPSQPICVSTVAWPNKDFITNYISSTQLTFDILASDMTLVGGYLTYVRNDYISNQPYQVSNMEFFFVTVAPILSISSISPNSTIVKYPTDPGIPLTANGTGFQQGAVIKFNGTPLTTAFVSTTQLTATVPVNELKISCINNIIVTNPNGGSTGALSFTVNNPVPSVSYIRYPVSRIYSDDNISIYGPNFPNGGGGPNFVPGGGCGNIFVHGSTMRFNGQDRPTTYVGKDELGVDLPASDFMQIGIFPVTIFNPYYGGGNGNSKELAVYSADISISKKMIGGAVSLNITTNLPTYTGSDSYTASFFPTTRTIGTNDTSAAFRALRAGTYKITQNLAPGWTLTSVYCIDINQVGYMSINRLLNGVSLFLDDGDNISCTFVNTKN